MSDSNAPQRRPSGSGIQFEKSPLANEASVTATVTLSRKAALAQPQPMPLMRGAAPMPTPPPPQSVMNMVYAVANQDDVGCPRCQATFDVTPQLFNAIAECPDCGLTFVIKPPGSPPYRGPIPGATIQAPAAGPAHHAQPHGMASRPAMPGATPRPAPLPAPAMPGRPAAVPPRMNTSGIAVSAQPLEGEDMMSTIEIQRSSRGLQQSLKQGIASPEELAEAAAAAAAQAPVTPPPQVAANRPAVRQVAPPAASHGQMPAQAGPQAAMRGPRAGAAVAMPAMPAAPAAGAVPPMALPQQGSVPPAIAQQATQRTNASGINVEKRGNDYGLTATVTLSRKGMGMAPQSKPGRPDAPVSRARPQAQLEGQNRMAYAMATATDVACPGCGSRFEITPDLYNATAECPDCQAEFIIRPPPSAPAAPPARGVAMPVAANAPTAVGQRPTMPSPGTAGAGARGTGPAIRQPVAGTALTPSGPSGAPGAPVLPQVPAGAKPPAPAQGGGRHATQPGQKPVPANSGNKKNTTMLAAIVGVGVLLLAIFVLLLLMFLKK